ncbi:MAG: hypothetical protein KKA07_00020 [Bacteroidetes bacterium]|nr:hypothetical protein [Bacteroidota bacterium]MBU1717436.1 hypothetical protein [Bacteroidota bacterium]
MIILLFSLLISGFCLLAAWALPAYYFSKGIPGAIILLLIINYIVHFFLVRSLHRKPQIFIRTFMVTTMLKLFFYAIGMIAYVVNFKNEALPFISWFVFLYVMFTGFEVYFISKALSRAKASGSAN